MTDVPEIASTAPWLWPAVSAVAAAAAATITALWRASEQRANKESAAKDVTIAILRTESSQKDRTINARDASLISIGAKLDATEEQLNTERLKSAGVAARMRLDSSIDEDDFEPDMPTAVRDMADLVVPKKSVAPPPPRAPTKPMLEPRAGQADYDDRRRRNAQQGVDTPTQALVPKALAEPFPRYMGRLVPNDEDTED